MKREIVKLTTKGQLTLPKEYRDRLGLNKGCQLTVAIKGNALILKKFYPVSPLSDQDPIWDMVGLFENHLGVTGAAKVKQDISGVAATKSNQGVSSPAVAKGNQGTAAATVGARKYRAVPAGAAVGRGITIPVVSRKNRSVSTTATTGDRAAQSSRGEVAACKKF